MAGYFTYGRFVERYFGVSAELDTPVKRLADGVDYQELKPWRMYVIQFLNIAGLGPIFGAIMGAAYGPMAYLWIVVGCIFMGAAHDFFSGMLSLRNDGKDLPEIVGTYLGKRMRQVLIVFAAFLLLAVGVSFVNGPAELLARLTGWDMTLVVGYLRILCFCHAVAHRQDYRQGVSVYGRCVAVYGARCRCISDLWRCYGRCRDERADGGFAAQLP